MLRAKGVPMPRHKYKIGQNLTFKANPTRALVGSQECKITRQLPIEDGSYLYRIKCVTENTERVAKEAELASRSLELEPFAQTRRQPNDPK
jgi:hypothetical protein